MTDAIEYGRHSVQTSWRPAFSIHFWRAEAGGVSEGIIHYLVAFSLAETNQLDLGRLCVIIKEQRPISYWTTILCLLVIAVLLFLVAASLLIAGPVTKPVR